MCVFGERNSQQGGRPMSNVGRPVFVSLVLVLFSIGVTGGGSVVDLIDLLRREVLGHCFLQVVSSAELSDGACPVGTVQLLHGVIESCVGLGSKLPLNACQLGDQIGVVLLAELQVMGRSRNHEGDHQQAGGKDSVHGDCRVVIVGGSRGR